MCDAFTVNTSFARGRAGDIFQGVGRIDRIDVPNANQIAAVIADVVNFPGKPVGQGPLDADGPSLHPGWNDVPGEGEDVAWPRVLEPIAALKSLGRAYRVRRKDWTG